MNLSFRLYAFALTVVALSGCASQGKPPPSISLDEPVQAQPLPEPPAPVEVVAMPEPLALPAQLKPLHELDAAPAKPEPADEKVRVSRANAEARIAPTREGYVNAIQVWPFTDGALYQVYAAPGRVTVVSLQPGEELVTVAAGDTVRWIVGDTSSGSGDAMRINVLVKPIRSGLKTNLVITTSRRTYLLELTSTEKAWMASVSWDYPKDRMLALQRQSQAASAAAPVDTGLSLEKIRFRYSVSGSNPPWKPLRAFDDGEKVYIQFPPGIAQGELPPLFVIGAQGDGQLVNYRFRSPYYIVDRLFGAAELRLGGDKGDVVRIERTDGLAREELTMSQDDTPDLATPHAGKVAPEAVALRAQPRPVTRLNRRTLAILVGGLSVAVLGALMWSLQPQRRGAGEQTELYNVDRVSKSEGLDALPADYSKLPPPLAASVPELGPPLPGDLGPAIVKSQQPVTAAYAAPGNDPNDALRKEAEAAAASAVFFRSGSQKAAPVAQTQVAAAPGFTANAAFDPLAAGPASTAAQPADPTAVQNRQDQKEAFQKAGTTEARDSGNLTLPASPYQVMAGTVVAGALVTGIKSDLPGDVIATVTEPVYDTATGKFLLIPQGSRILGKYNSQVSYGQSRVQVVWNRIILPDTSSLKLDNLAGTDPAGYAGLEDDVDWHWDRVFAGAALTTLLGIGAELAAPENRQDGDRVIIAGRDSAQDSINQVGQEMTRRNLNIQPTLTERPGLPVRIIVNRDLVLRPYQPLFFNRGDFAMTTRKLRLGPLPKTESTKLTFACPASLKADLDRYATLHAQTYGEAVDATVLIPHMLEAFMVGDRGFRKGGAGKAAPPKPS